MAMPEGFFGVFDRELAPDTCQEIIHRFEADPRKVRGMVGDSRRAGGAVDPGIKPTTEILSIRARRKPCR